MTRSSTKLALLAVVACTASGPSHARILHVGNYGSPGNLGNPVNSGEKAGNARIQTLMNNWSQTESLLSSILKKHSSSGVDIAKLHRRWPNHP